MADTVVETKETTVETPVVEESVTSSVKESPAKVTPIKEAVAEVAENTETLKENGTTETNGDAKVDVVASKENGETPAEEKNGDAKETNGDAAEKKEACIKRKSVTADAEVTEEKKVKVSDDVTEVVEEAKEEVTA